MSKIVVAKKVRLGMDGDQFNKDLIAKVERTNAKVDDEYLKDFNKNWKTSGRLYIVDEKATAERDASLTKEAKPSKDSSKDVREALKKEADDMGLEYPKNISNEKLAELISNKK